MKRVLLVLFISLLAFGSNAQQVIYDIEGNAYDTLKIGNQIWFKQNLKTTKYNYVLLKNNRERGSFMLIYQE